MAEEADSEVRREMAMPPDAPPPPMPRAVGGWDRAVEPHILQANASAMFCATALVDSLTPIAEAANLSLDDIDVKMPHRVTVAKRWTLEVKGRDARTAARHAAMLMGALRDGAGWRRVEVASAVGERVPLYIAPDKNPRAVKREVVGERFLAELRTRHPGIAWRPFARRAS